ncbi:MAG TPA: arginase family protein, partial [Xanthobacteraceae bacterium]|nr:arginase family protein [Xanthobacteraceae bacterium]
MAAMDEEDLRRLREKYGGTHGARIHRSDFRAVADHVFDAGGRRAAPYSGVPTFLSAPYRPSENHPDDDLQVAIVGVPMDLGVSNRSGARFGPRALRAIERIGPYNDVLGCCPVFDLRVADVGDVAFRSRFDLNLCHQDIETCFGRIVDRGTCPLAVGGDHSISRAVLKAVGQRRPVGLVHIDAHCDTGGEFDQTKFHHGGPFRLAVLDGVLDPTRTIQIGIRGSAEYLWEFSVDSGMTVVHAHEIDGLGIAAIVARARAVVGDGPVYVSFDIDALDPAFAPGTGTPEIGGL